MNDEADAMIESSNDGPAGRRERSALLLQGLGVTANVAAVAAVPLSGRRAIVLVCSLGAVVVGVNIVWGRWRQMMDAAVVVALAITIAGAGVFGYALAYDTNDEGTSVAAGEDVGGDQTSDSSTTDHSTPSTSTAATMATSSSSTAATTTVVPPSEPEISIAPDQKLIEQDGAVTVEGSGFGSGERVRINVSENDLDDSCAPVQLSCVVLREVQATAEGDLEPVQVTILNDHITGFEGTYYVNVIGITTGRITSHPFRVLESA